MQSKASTVSQYLTELPADRRAMVESVRQIILENLDEDFEEGMQYGMIGYYVPHRVFPEGYHCDPKQPLPFAALASQKNYLSLYIMTLYGDGAQLASFQKEWAKTGKKLDMGKCCIRFKRLEDLALDVVARTFRRTTAKAYIEIYQKLREGQTQRPRAKPKVTAAAATKRKPAARAKAVKKPSTKATRKR